VLWLVGWGVGGLFVDGELVFFNWGGDWGGVIFWEVIFLILAGGGGIHIQRGPGGGVPPGLGAVFLP
jgi:hypothetical protein